MQDEPVLFEHRDAWRRWLQKNHDKRDEIWVLGFKKHVGRMGISYEEALEEAICYGWIDCRMKRIDDDKHMWRFAPRRPNSIWSQKNRTTAERLIAEGKMTVHGMNKIEAARRSGEWENPYRPSRPPSLPKDLRDALKDDETAWNNFHTFAKSYRHTYIHWVNSAKKDDTRKRRIREVVRLARLNKKSITI